MGEKEGGGGRGGGGREVSSRMSDFARIRSRGEREREKEEVGGASRLVAWDTRLLLEENHLFI